MAVWPLTARADPAAAKPFYDRGIVDYNLGHFAEAIIQFERAYEHDRAPILLFNLAQAHRQFGNSERALFFYRRYLESDPNAANRPDVEKRMAELDEMVRGQAEVKSRPPTAVAVSPPVPAQQTDAVPNARGGSPVASQTGAGPAGTPPAATTSTTGSPAQAGGGDSGATLKIAGIATASVGAASLLVGVVFSARVSSRSDDVTGAPVFNPDTESSAKSAATMQWVFYGVGVAAIAAGAGLYYFGHQEARAKESRVALVPVMGPGQPAGAALWMSF